MDEQYKKMLEQLARVRREYKVNPDVPKPTITSTGGMINMDFSSLYPSTITYHFGGKSKKRIKKIKNILNRINDNTQREI